MTTDEIRAMFMANAALKKLSPADVHRKSLEDLFERLVAQYESEYFIGKDWSSEPKKLSFPEAFDIVVKSCQVATALEIEHHPNGITDEDVNGMALARKAALDRVLDEYVDKNKQ